MQRYAPVAISLSHELLEWVNTRAEHHGVSRSAYVQQLIRQDLATGTTTDGQAIGKRKGIHRTGAEIVFKKVKATRAKRRAARLRKGKNSCANTDIIGG